MYRQFPPFEMCEQLSDNRLSIRTLSSRLDVKKPQPTDLQCDQFSVALVHAANQREPSFNFGPPS
jgi:hypothetical protein